VRVRALFALVAAAVVLPVAATAQAPSLRAELAGSLRGEWLSPGRTAAYAIELRTGRVLFAHNAASPFVPASNAKLPVAFAALKRLGPSFRFQTEVMGAGTRAGRFWRGDLVLRGHGDPTLSGADLDALAAAVRAEGITRVTGWIGADESFFDTRRGAPGWKRGWVGIESPPLSALAADRAYGWPAMPPALLAAKAFRRALQRHGVSVANGVRGGRAPAGAVTVATDRSVSLARIVRDMDSDSDNYTAELLLKALGASTGAVGSTAAGARIVMEELAAAGVDTTGVRVADGSGLSRLDRLTTTALVQVIQAALDDPKVGGPFLASLAVAGRTGTLRERLPALRWKVRGKTGTTSIACSLSGVVGDEIAFSVIQNGFPVASWAARAAQDRFVTVLAGARARSG
jgi:D-alanyl-D-alanine carboxypeptidase/D-alanyl-D-alanine-endopeptidase (penicillin-binding protein 4)